MFLFPIFQILSRRELTQKKINPYDGNAYKKAVEDFESSSDFSLKCSEDTTGEKIYYQEGLRELFPGHTKPTDESLIEIRDYYKMANDMTPPYIWLCLNINSDRVLATPEIMKILRNDPNVHCVIP